MTIRLCTRSVEFRADTETNDGRTLSGYAAVFDTDTEINSWEGSFLERLAPGAFKKTLKERKNVSMQYNHGHDARVGTVPIGVYSEMREDNQGLYVEGRLFENDVVEPVRQAIEAGAISGMSFAFRVVRDEWRDANNKLVRGEELQNLLWQPGERGPLSRNIKEVQLFEAGPVLNPAYAATSVGVRSLEDITDEDRNALVAEYRKTMGHADEDDEDERLAEWLAAEQVYTDEQNLREWLEAETLYRTQVSDKAVREDTLPEEPVEAVQKDTSHRVAAPESKSIAGQSKRGNKMNIAEMRARRTAIAERLTELGTEFRDVSLPEEARTEWDSLETETEELSASITEIEGRTARLTELAKAPAASKRFDKAPEVHIQKDVFDLDEMRASAYGSADFLERVGEGAARAIDGARYGVRDKSGAAEHVSMLLDEVDTENRDIAKRILLTGSEAYTRGWAKILKHGSDAFCTNDERQALLRAQALVPDASGGYAVPFQLDPTLILTNGGVTNTIRDIARVENIVGKTWQGVTSAGASVTRGVEASTAPDASFTLAQPTLQTNRVQGFVPFSIELEMSWGALSTEITRVLVDAKAREEDSLLMGNGTGTAPGGVVGTFAGTTVLTAGIGAFAAADVYSLQDSLSPRWENNSAFLAHKAIYHKIRQFDTAGGAQFWGYLAEANKPKILDYPAFKSSAMDSTLVTGKNIMLYGDFSQFLIADRLGMTVELIPHLFDQANGNRPTGQRGIYAVWMNNSKILVPGAFSMLQVK